VKIRIDRKSPTPIYLQIAGSLRETILAGGLPAGRKLPPSRRLAGSLGVNRSTVVQAYDLLWSEGLLESRVGSGTVVRAPSTANDAELVEQEVRELGRVIGRSDVISLAGGLPSPDLYPLETLGRIASEVLSTGGGELLQWCEAAGYPPLRNLFAGQIPGVSPKEILVLPGSTQGLYLLSRALLEPGDAVVVESPTYLGALHVFGAAGARILGVPVDEQGMRIDMLDSLLGRARPKLIYTQPSYHNPSGFSLPLERRRALLDLACRHRVPVVEDDAYSRLVYEGEDLPSLKALDTHDHVIYLSTFTKTLCPGLRIGFLAAPAPVIERLAPEKYLIDLFTNTLAQAVIFEFLHRGHLEAHLARVREEYRRRRDVLSAALRESCPQLEFGVPGGGYFIWARLPRGVRARDLLREALGEGVSFMFGDVFYPDGRGQDRIRLSFPSQTPGNLEDGARRLGAALRRLAKKKRKGKTASDEEIALRPVL
jgi:2-aminoadipate transaminase